MLEERQAHSQRLNEDVHSVQALANLLKAVIENPLTLKDRPALEHALGSQGMLAKYSSERDRVHSMSLNHMKKICVTALGSFAVLDELRRAAARVAAHVRKPPPTPSPKVSLIEKCKALEEEKQWLLQDLFLLQRAYDTRCIQARSYADHADAATRARCKKEQAELDASFSLRKMRLMAENVSPIDKGKRRGTPS